MITKSIVVAVPESIIMKLLIFVNSFEAAKTLISLSVPSCFIFTEGSINFFNFIFFIKDILSECFSNFLDINLSISGTTEQMQIISKSPRSFFKKVYILFS